MVSSSELLEVQTPIGGKTSGYPWLTTHGLFHSLQFALVFDRAGPVEWHSVQTQVMASPPNCLILPTSLSGRPKHMLDAAIKLVTIITNCLVTHCKMTFSVEVSRISSSVTTVRVGRWIRRMVIICYHNPLFLLPSLAIVFLFVLMFRNNLTNKQVSRSQTVV